MRILITGASKGLGKEFALYAASLGHDLVLVARDKQLMIELKQTIEKEYHVKVNIFVYDLSVKSSALKLYEIIKHNNLEIDCLINNAGFGLQGEFASTKLQTNVDMIELNIVNLVELTHLFLNDFLRENKGKIMNVSSIASLCPGPLEATYFATKAFVSSFSYAIWEEIKHSNVTITTLLPGALKTNFEKNANLTNTKLFAKTKEPKDVAIKAFNAMLKGKRRILTGTPLSTRFGLWLTKFTPMSWTLKIVYNLQKKQDL